VEPFSPLRRSHIVPANPLDRSLLKELLDKSLGKVTGAAGDEDASLLRLCDFA
jgi:hypothetical protein